MSKENTSNKRSIEPTIELFILVALVMVIAWAMLGVFTYKTVPGIDMGTTDMSADRGTFGDMFGASNALFSALAFAGVIFAIIAQRYELSQHREEAKESRKALQKQVAVTQQNRLELTRSC